MSGGSIPMFSSGAPMPARCSRSRMPRRSPAAAAMPSWSIRAADPRATTRSCARAGPTKARAFPTRCNMRCARPASSRTWIEDSGRWFAGPDGKPSRAHGVVRVINERHEREERLAYLSRFDALTGEMNRWAHDRGARSHDRGSGQAAFLVRLPAGRGRQSRPHQRGLRFRYRRRGDRRDRQADSPPVARQGSPRALFRQQVRHHPEDLHARRHADRRRPPARRRARGGGADQRPGRSPRR